MVDNGLQKAKQQIAEARQQVKTGREKAIKSQAQLRQAKQRLPSRTSQRALRQTMGGLKGRITRRKIAKVEKRFEKEGARLEQFKSDITQFEKSLIPIEEKIQASEQEIKRIKEYNVALEQVRKAAAKGKVHLIAQFGEKNSLVRELAKKYVKGKNLQKKAFSKQVRQFELENPTEDLQVDFDKLRITGVKSGALGETLTLKQYNKKIKEFQQLSQVDVPAETLKVVPQQSLVTGALGLNISDSKLRDDIDVPSRDDSGILGKIRSSITGFASRIIGDKEDFEKGKGIFTGAVISAATGKERLTEREFTQVKFSDPSLEPQFGTQTKQFGGFDISGKPIEVETSFVTFGEQQVRRDIAGQAPISAIFIQQAPVTKIEQAISFIPVVGQIEPVVESSRKLSGEIRVLSGAESILGMGKVSQEGVRRATLSAGLNLGLLGLDITLIGGVGKSVGKAVSQKLVAKRLAKATPEVFIGAERGIGDSTEIAIVAVRKTGKEEARTLTRFEVFKTGDKTFQVQKGRGIQQITKEGKEISKKGFTFFGESQQVEGKLVPPGKGIEVSEKIKEPTSAFFSDIQVLTKGESPELIRSLGVGLQRQEGKLTKVLTFPAKKGIRLKTGETRVINLDTGKIVIRDEFGKIKIRKTISDVDSIGVIKRVGKEESGETIIIQEGQSLVLKTKTTQVGSTVGLQVESKLLKAVKIKPEVKSIIPTFSPGQEVEVISQQAQTLSVPTQNVFMDSLVGVQKAVGGSGLTQQQLDQARGGQVPDTIQQRQPEALNLMGRADLNLGSGLKQDARLEIKGRQEFRALQEVQLDQVTSEKLKGAQTSALDILQDTRQRTKQKQVTEQEQVIKQKVKIKTKPPKKPPIKPKPLLFGELFKAALKKEAEKGQFKVKVRKGGKDIKIGESKSLAGAKEKLLTRLKETLRASGHVELRGKKVNVGFLGKGFRRGKKDPLRVVEIREKRIKKAGKSAEAREIQFFRKSKSKRFF